MHVCLFDIDGTLLSTGGAGQAAMQAAIGSLFKCTKSMAHIAMAGRTDRAIAVDMFAEVGIDADDATWQRFERAYYRHLAVTLGKHNGMVLPGIVALLELLAARGDVLLGLLTGNYRQGAQIKLGHYGLAHHFAFGGFGDRHVDRDDVAREAIEELARHNGQSVDVSRVWVIGDTPADVRCARAVGANVLAVATGNYSVEALQATRPDQLLADFSDPNPLLSLLA